MASSAELSRQGKRLLQIGIALVLFASFEGFAIPQMASPRIGLSTHTLSALEGIFLLVQGLLWPRLQLSATLSRLAFWCSIYSTLAILGAYTLAALSGAGIESIALNGQLPEGLSHGSASLEGAIRLAAYSSAPTGITCYGLILWGLR
jgi:hydroxylaminobenzene mutase